MNGKGDTQRPTNYARFAANYEAIKWKSGKHEQPLCLLKAGMIILESEHILKCECERYTRTGPGWANGTIDMRCETCGAVIKNIPAQFPDDALDANGRRTFGTELDLRFIARELQRIGGCKK